MDYPATEILKAKTAGLGSIARPAFEEFAKYIRDKHPGLPIPPRPAAGHPIMASELAGDKTFTPRRAALLASPSYLLTSSPPPEAVAKAQGAPTGQYYERLQRMAAGTAPGRPTGSLIYNGPTKGLAEASGRPITPAFSFGHEMGHAVTVPVYRAGKVLPDTVDDAVRQYSTDHPQGARKAVTYGLEQMGRTRNPVDAELHADAISHGFLTSLAERDPAAHQRLLRDFERHDAMMASRALLRRREGG